MDHEIQQPARKLQVLSDEMAEFIGKQSHWIIRKGNYLFLFVFALLLSLSWVIEFPDTIVTSMHIMAVNSPKLLIAKTDGHIEKILVGNGQEIAAGQNIAFLQSTANPEEVVNLAQWIERIESGKPEDYLANLSYHPFTIFNGLGEVQSDYEEFESTVKETQQTLSSGYYEKRRQALLNDLADIQQSMQVVLSQKKMACEDYDLQKIEFKAKESLARDKVISSLEFNQDKSKLLGKQQSIEGFTAQIINMSMAEQGKQKEILELQKFVEDQRQKFQRAVFILKSKLQEWMQHYIVTAPISGKLSYVGFLQENQYVQNNQELFYIIPASEKFYGEVKVGQQGLGKIEKGQKVIVRVNSFPSNEFGYLVGTVSYIPSLIESDSSSLIRVEFTKGLATNFGRELSFKNNMIASAEIITQNRHLLEKLIGQLRNLMAK